MIAENDDCRLQIIFSKKRFLEVEEEIFKSRIQIRKKKNMI